MRIFSKMPVMVLTLLAAASSVCAQGFPSIAIDSSFRVEYLLGGLQSRYSPPSDETVDRLKIDVNAQVAVLSGVAEITPMPGVSGRLMGAISVWERSGSFARPRDHRVERADTIDWQAKPDFSQWEVAGLYHLWNAAGYRFSLTAGYRQEKWTFNGEPTGFAQGNLKDEYTSSVPFIGMQTSMLFPWWKARFEVLGSPFMSKRAINNFSGTLNDGTPIGLQTDGSASDGGLIEFQMEGSVGLSPSLFLGVNASYTFQELYGNSTVKSPVAPEVQPVQYRLYTSESIFRIGVDVNILF
jgi:hypothetical protein